MSEVHVHLAKRSIESLGLIGVQLLLRHCALDCSTNVDKRLTDIWAV